MAYIPGGDELWRNLNNIAGRGAAKGWYAQLKWLTEAHHRRDRTVAFFANRSRDPVRLLRGWLAHPPDVYQGIGGPSPANEAEIRQLYQREFRASRTVWLKRHLANDGDGTIIELYASPEVVQQSHGGVQDYIDLPVYPTDWIPIVNHWAAEQRLQLQDDWRYLVAHLYPPGAYDYVDHLTFS